uniref:Uncharacterized protein n=1 Tax=Tanacetum cinerariifolium TaxID=118510 RepID=A0A6L2MJN2_TANCI|nr:hypothetical protein [Tanacetum cinerariifolium]
MADMNIPVNDAPAEQAHAFALPTRADDQILPSSKWVPIGKRHSRHPLRFMLSTFNNFGTPCALTHLWGCTAVSWMSNGSIFILRDALDIIPANDNNPYVAPPSSNTVIEYVNTLGYLSILRNVAAMSAKPPYVSDSLRKNLATASRGKKKTTHLLIPNVRLVGKDGREIFGMPIPDALLTDEIKGAPYYGATKSLKATKGTKPKAAKATNPAGDKASTLTSTQPPKPKPSPTQPSKAVLEKKQKLPTQGKGKEKVIDEQDAHDLLTVLTPKNKIPVDQFSFQRRTPMFTKASRHAESPSLDAKLPLTNNETKSDNVASKIHTRDQDEGQAGPNPGDHDEGQAGLNPGVQDEGQAGSNPSDAAESQPQSSHVVHVGPNRKHMDLEATDASTLQNPEQMDEEFTTTAYPNVHENLKLTSKDFVIHEEPASSTETLSSLQNLKKELSFTDQFFVKKQQEEEPGKTNLSIPNINNNNLNSHGNNNYSTTTTSTTTKHHRSNFSEAHRCTRTTYGEFALIQLNPGGKVGQTCVPTVQIRESQHPSQGELAAEEIVTDAVDWKFYDALEKLLERDYLEQLLSDLEEARQKKRNRRDVPRTPFGSPPPQPPHPPPPPGASGASGTSGASGSSQFPPPPPPSSTGTSGSAQQRGSKAPSSSKYAVSTPQSMAWTTSNTRYESADVSMTQELSPMDSLIQDDSIPDEQVHLSDDEDSGNDHIQKLIREKTGGNHYLKRKDQRLMNLLRPFLLPLYQMLRITSLLRHVTIQTQFFFNKYLEYLRYGTKGISPALSISKMKAASYPDFGLELLVPEQMWIDNPCFSVASKRSQINHVDSQCRQELNPTPNTGYEVKHDYTIIESPQAVVFSVNNNKRKIMQFNEIYKFSEGTLTQILEALAYRVKEFKIKRLNPGTPSSMCQTISNIDAHVKGEQFQMV